MRTILCLALALLGPAAASAKGGHVGHAQRSAPTADVSPGAMVSHGTSPTSGNSRPVNASAKPDASPAAKVTPPMKK